MSSVLHLGLPPKANQVISAELSARGITLLKCSPAQLNALVYNQVNQPFHDSYLANLPAFVEAARSSGAVSIGNGYFPLQENVMPTLARNPIICWSYTHKLTVDEVNNLKTQYGCSEDVIKGKPVYTARLSIQELQRLIQDTSPVETTANNAGCINIASLRAYRSLWKHIHAILSCNQYPYFDTNDQVDQRVDIDARWHYETRNSIGIDTTGKLRPILTTG